MIQNVIVIIAVLIAGAILFSKRLQKSKTWRATVTPLASIIGSGFLVAAPLMADNVGDYAIFVMATLIVLAYFVGSAIRFNIRYLEPILAQRNNQSVIHTFSEISQITLTVAYFISVAYYLNLLSAFLLNGMGISSHFTADCITTGILLLIGFLGWIRGLSIFENIEKYAVGVNFAMIGGLLLGLLYFNFNSFLDGEWRLLTHEPNINLNTFRVLLGLLIVVQGFETSRFLGAEYSAELRIKTMKKAQIISGIIYLVFIVLITELFRNLQGTAGVTGIIQVSGIIALILPVCLTISAVGSQFSAAIADTAGAGGLIGEVSRKRIKIKYAYPLIALVAIAITWGANVYTIICYASRAFALFYAFQCLLAFFVAFQSPKNKHRFVRLLLFGFLFILCLMAVIFGLSSEG